MNPKKIYLNKKPPGLSTGGFESARDRNRLLAERVHTKPASLEVGRQQFAVIRIGQLAKDVDGGLCRDPLDATVAEACIDSVTGVEAERLVVRTAVVQVPAARGVVQRGIRLIHRRTTAVAGGLPGADGLVVVDDTLLARRARLGLLVRRTRQTAGTVGVSPTIRDG